MKRLLMWKPIAFFLIFIFPGIVSGDELVNRHVGPGVKHRKFYFAEGPWAVDVLEVALSNPYMGIETVKAKDRIIGREKTSDMAKRNNRNGHWIVGAINADFFAADGTPVNCQISDGILLQKPGDHSVLGFYENLKPFIQIPNYRGVVVSEKGSDHVIDGINEKRDTDELILYNRFFNPGTKTNGWGAEYQFRTLDKWTVNDTFRLVVTAVDSTRGNQAIPYDGGVLSGHGASRNWLLAHVSSGDTLKICLQLSPTQKRIKEAVGGIPRIIRDGKISIEEGYDGVAFSTTWHPRTAVGFSQDSTTLYLLTVDGRQTGYSAGMPLRKLAEFLIELGAYQAINLDGGGSTTMVVRGKIENSPSDAGGERAVANALMVISYAPLDTLSILDISPDSLRIFQHNSFQFKVAGFDRFYNPIPAQQMHVTWACDPQSGIIDPNSGLFTAGEKHVTTWVTVTAGFCTDSAKIIVDTPIAILSGTTEIFLSVGDTTTVFLQLLDSGGNLHYLPFSHFQWQLSDSIVSVSTNGMIRANTAGTTNLAVQYDSLQLNLPVYVAMSGEVLLDDFSFGAVRWNFDGIGVNLRQSVLTYSDSLYVSPPKSVAVQYEYKKKSTPSYYSLKRSFMINSQPKMFSIRIHPDNNLFSLQGVFRDANGRIYTLDFERDGSAVIDWPHEWREMKGLVTDAKTRGGASPVFPITWQNFRLFCTGGEYGQTVSGVIYLDDFQADFFTNMKEEFGRQQQPRVFRLHSGYPNPCRIQQNSYHFVFQLGDSGELSVAIFNLMGQKLFSRQKHYTSSGLHQFDWDGSTNAGKLAGTGIYFAELKFHRLYQRQKFVLIR